jgi:TPR repeat protein
MTQQMNSFFAGGSLAVILLGTAIAGPLEDAKSAADRGDYAVEWRLLPPLANHGEANAQLALGTLYQKGEGVRRNGAKAIAWYRKAADQGNVIAQNNLGAMYASGDGASQDYAQAITWLRKAADQGDAIAEDNLGLMYTDGNGLPQDFARAYALFNLSASHAEDDETRAMAIQDRDLVAAKTSSAEIARLADGLRIDLRDVALASHH